MSLLLHRTYLSDPSRSPLITVIIFGEEYKLLANYSSMMTVDSKVVPKRHIFIEKLIKVHLK
jgi:hypothetical protein